MRKIDKNGFTILELIIVVGIISILVTMTFVIFGRPRSDSRNAARLAQVSEIQKALEIYANQNDGYYPLSLSDLVMSGALSRYPTIPDTGTGQGEPLYVPIGQNLCTSYHLGVLLEHTESAVRQVAIDDDLAPRQSCSSVSDFHGVSSFCTQESVGDDYCYDISP